MRVIQFSQFGDPSQLRLVERPDLTADQSTALVQVVAAAVNPSDVKNVAGRMEQTTLPRIPGRDYSGLVVNGPADWLGKEVWGTGGDVGFTRDGTHAEYISVPRTSLVRKPQSLTHEQAGSAGVTFVTAWCAVYEYAALKAGETIAVIGSKGGVGRAAVQIAKYLGAFVIGINRSRDDEAILEDLVLDSSDPMLPELLRSMNAGKGADVVFNTAGGPMFEIGLTLLARRGRQVEITSPTARRATSIWWTSTITSRASSASIPSNGTSLPPRASLRRLLKALKLERTSPTRSIKYCRSKRPDKRMNVSQRDTAAGWS
ncbi:zinc-binding alcohol dehydrogenase family protein [Tunturibacter psychrotolerans]|uniref:Zinc-binding alcohol dehydrogenase family protein n=1 Tax=Tunturiibacter psychrotolerans TaxID=3069686 RepID=A0AAU7ZW51_9BACT